MGELPSHPVRGNALSDARAALQSGLNGHYVLERELGHGGMAMVWLAQDLEHHRPVALKLLRAELVATLGPERFRREIETAARLQHPHILSVHDSGEAGGFLWFTMPYVRGESLRDRLRREGRLPVAEALRVTGEAAQALRHAHDEGVVQLLTYLKLTSHTVGLLINLNVELLRSGVRGY